MFLGFIGAIVGGIGLAGTLLAISKIFRLSLPKWIYPAAVGFGMIGLSIHIEYSWFARQGDQLPADVEIVQTFSRTSFYQPWTYVVPRIDRYIAVDHTSVRLNEAAPDLVLLDVFLIERFNQPLVALQFVDCVLHARSLVEDDTVLNENGLPDEPNWVELGSDHPIVASVCPRHHPASQSSTS